MAIYFRSLFLIFGIYLLVSLQYSCKHDPVENPTVPPIDTTVTPIDTTDVPDPGNPENAADSIQYHLVDHVVQAGATNFVILVDSLTNAQLSFSIVGTFLYATAQGGQILDNSTHGYPDALIKCTEINAQGNWSNGQGLISTSVGNGGQFRGKNNGYLGFRFPDPQGGYHYGWARLSCNTISTMLTISDYAFRTEPDSSILAGQKNLDLPCSGNFGPSTLVNQLDQIIGNYHSEQSTNCAIQIKPSTEPGFDFTVQYFPFLWPYYRIPGRIVNGKLSLPSFHFEGNIPSPGGQDRLYSGDISGSGEMFVQNGTTTIVWQISYDKTGFLAESYHGEFIMELCH